MQRKRNTQRAAERERKFNLNRTSKGQRAPKLLLLPCHLVNLQKEVSVHSSQFLMYKCVQLRQDKHKASSGYQDELCSVSLSKCISSPNYMEKFPELSAKQVLTTTATQGIRRVLTPKELSERQHTEGAQLLSKGLPVLPEELARSHNASWKERGSDFSPGFQAHVVTARGRHARNFIP